MSRIGKQPISIPAGVDVQVTGTEVSVKGPKGAMVQKLHGHVSAAVADGVLLVSVKDENLKSDRALWGLFQRLISNMVHGVTKGFDKKLEINGVGYKVAPSAKGLTLHLGYSHPIEFELPKGVQAVIEKNTITLSGVDKQEVGEVAACIRALRKPEPYKGKGIKYSTEVIRRKSGKAAKAGAK